jgi:hypothetical protein
MITFFYDSIIEETRRLTSRLFQKPEMRKLKLRK